MNVIGVYVIWNVETTSILWKIFSSWEELASLRVSKEEYVLRLYAPAEGGFEPKGPLGLVGS